MAHQQSVKFSTQIPGSELLWGPFLRGKLWMKNDAGLKIHPADVRERAVFKTESGNLVWCASLISINKNKDFYLAKS